jgi:nucleoside-diphosphate-sugar epimerase
MQTILVIGAAGFIGKHLVRRLASAGHTVHATHRPGKRPPLPGIHWLAADLSRAEDVTGWPAYCDTVVYLAQSRHWRNFPESARDVFGVNVQGLMQAAWYAQQVQAGRFIYASTGSVYSQQRQAAVETDACDLQEPRSFYVACKLAGEVLLGPYQSLFSVVSLRLFMPYGEGQGADMLLPRLVKCVREGSPIKLHGQGGLLANPVAVTDVVETIDRCLTLEASATLNVGGPEQLSLRQIGNTIGKVIGREPVFEVQPEATAPVLVGTTTLLEQTLGWRPATRLEVGLREWLARRDEYTAVPA